MLRDQVEQLTAAVAQAEAKEAEALKELAPLRQPGTQGAADGAVTAPPPDSGRCVGVAERHRRMHRQG